MIDSIFKKKNILGVILIITSLILLSFDFISAPDNFEGGTLVNINDGETINQVAISLEESGVIKSADLFSFLILLDNNKVFSGDYIFHERENIFQIVKRISTGDYDIPLKKITLTEGMTVYTMGEYLSSEIPSFNKDLFVSLASKEEGYLFPDTYLVRENIKPEELIKLLKDTFSIKISSIQNLIDNSDYSLEEIIIMASIVEKEATGDSRQDVADILWKRIEINMPLQVDAPFTYLLGKTSAELTLDDLDLDSDFNTYNNLGLTPAPISNPGLDSILAAANPGETPYLFFITGDDGNMYYAKDFDNHKKNVNLYIE